MAYKLCIKMCVNTPLNLVFNSDVTLAKDGPFDIRGGAVSGIFLKNNFNVLFFF